MVFPLAALAVPAIGAIGSVASGWFNRKKKQKDDPTRQGQAQNINNILQGLSGQGPYAHLFKADQNTFQNSYVQPQLDMWNNQIAPQIQQQYIQSGQQKGTGIDDALARSGYDMTRSLNQDYGNFQNSAMNRQMQGISQIGGPQQGAPQDQGNQFNQALGGYLGGTAFTGGLESILNALSPRSQQQQQNYGMYQIPRRGFS